MNPTDIVVKIRAANATRESYLPWSDYEEAANEIERLRGVLQWIDGQSNLFFAECPQAEEIVSRVRAVLGARRPIDLLMALAYTDAWNALPNDMQEEICVAVGWQLPPDGTARTALSTSNDSGGEIGIRGGPQPNRGPFR